MNLASMIFLTGAAGAVSSVAWGMYKLAVLGCQFIGDRLTPEPMDVHPCSPSLMASVERISAEAQFDEDVSDMANVLLEEIDAWRAEQAL